MIYIQEIWKEIEYGGLKYFVSNLGKISGSKRGLLKQRINVDGYCEVTVGIKERRTRERVHRLVALAFIDNPNNLPEVNHKDFNRLNNIVDNLEWCTHEYNIEYSKQYNHDVMHNARLGVKNGRAILTDTDVINIRNLYDNGNGLTIANIARLYNRGWQTINHIIKRSTWNHI